MSSATVFCVLALALAASAHICLIDPHQRGKLDISQPGDETCFRHGFPCGGTLPVNKSLPVYPEYQYWPYMTVSFQQNLNHYEVGYPGYMDVAWAHGGSPTKESDFTTMYQIPDYNSHEQRSRTGYNLYLNPPNISCEHCVLRVRYVSHKPGEETFYQCADVTFRQYQITGSMDDYPQKMVPRATPGDVPDPSASNCKQTSLDVPLTGILDLSQFYIGRESELITVGSVSSCVNTKGIIPFGIRRRRTTAPTVDDPPRPYVLDHIFTYDSDTNTSYMMAHDHGDWEAWPATLLKLTPTGLQYIRLKNQINAVNGLAFMNGAMYAFIITNSTTAGAYEHVLGQIDLASGEITELARSTPQNTFINFQWLAAADGKVYVLLGDENSLYQLGVTLFVYDVTAKTVTPVKMDVSNYTISGFHIIDGTIYATSPGLLQQNSTSSAWWLVTLDPSTGAIEPVFEIAPEGMFAQHYTQMIFNNPPGRIILRLDTFGGELDDIFGTLSVLATVDIASRKVTFSQPNLLESLHNIAYTPQ